MRNRWIAVLGVAALVLATAVALDTSRAANATFRGSNGNIAFFSNRTTAENPEGDWEIFTMKPDGSNVTQLTHNGALDWEPAVSPDGKRIAFFSDRDGNNEIYVMNSDGTGAQTRLTNDPASDHSPVFSSDGNTIYFASDRDGNSEIYAVNADGSGTPTNLTRSPSYDGDPTVSPEGKIAFASDRDGVGEIYTMNPDGSNQTRLTYDGINPNYLNYSPDGKSIVFHTNIGGNCYVDYDSGHWICPDNYEIYAVDADGNNLRNLTNSPARETHPSPSPDGTKIAFESDRDGNQELYTMNWDGSDWTRLTDNPTGDAGPDWQPLPYDDTTPPKVSSTSPSNLATGVPATANITATFLEEGSGIDPGTLTDGTFKVVQVNPTGNVPVSGTLGLAKGTQTATFDPSSSLAKGLYKATLTTGIKDKAGNALARDYSWTFTTAGPSKK